MPDSTHLRSKYLSVLCINRVKDHYWQYTSSYLFVRLVNFRNYRPRIDVTFLLLGSALKLKRYLIPVRVSEIWNLKLLFVKLKMISAYLFKAVTQLKRLVAGFPRRQLGFDPQVRTCGMCGRQSGTEGRFSPSTSVSHANSHSTDCSIFIIIYHPGLAN
jgi:hypothetical protein